MIEAMLEEELRELGARDLYRSLRVLENPGGTRAGSGGRDLLLFCGNDYLGLSRHPRVIEAARAAAAQCGVGAGASRLISGTSRLHAELESGIAAFKGKERALVFATGYMANLGALSALAGAEDLIVFDKLCHASIVDGAKLSGARMRTFPHLNYARLEEILSSESGCRRRLMVTESVFSMDGDLADLAELVRLKEKYDCLLVVDDAHGTGVLGKSGRGAAEDLRLEGRIDILMGTLSKALGSLGGFIAGSATMIDYLINRSRPFIFATALPPMIAAAALAALQIIREDASVRSRLWENAGRLHAGFRRIGFSLGPLASPILPLRIGAEGEALRLSEALLAQGILVPAIRTPTVRKGQARLRVTASALHSAEELERLLSALRFATRAEMV